MSKTLLVILGIACAVITAAGIMWYSSANPISREAINTLGNLHSEETIPGMREPGKSKSGFLFNFSIEFPAELKDTASFLKATKLSNYLYSSLSNYWHHECKSGFMSNFCMESPAELKDTAPLSKIIKSSGKQNNYTRMSFNFEPPISFYPREDIPLMAETFNTPNHFASYDPCKEGQIYAEQGKYEKALEVFDKAIEQNPTESKLWRAKGVTLEKAGKPDEAVKAHSKADELGQKKGDHYWRLAVVASCTKDKYSTLDRLREAISFDARLKSQIKKDTSFQWLWEDEEFKKLTEETK